MKPLVDHDYFIESSLKAFLHYVFLPVELFGTLLSISILVVTDHQVQVAEYIILYEYVLWSRLLVQKSDILIMLFENE